MKIIHISTIFLIVFFYENCAACKIRREVRLDRLESCFNGSNSPLRADYITISYNDKSGGYFNAKGEVLRDLKNNQLKMQAKVQRCASKEALDSCEYFANLKPPNLCIFLNMKGAAWESMLGNIEPPFKCPIKKSVYVARNATFDANLFNVFPLEGFYWKTEIRLFEDVVNIGAFCFEGSIIVKHC